jgi:hypothetical protein
LIGVSVGSVPILELALSPSSTTGIDMHGLFDPGHLRACPFCIRSVRDTPGLSSAISGSFGQFSAFLEGRSRADSGPSHLGGCGGKIENCLPITKGWNYTLRLFRPRTEILDGTWKFLAAQPVS